MAAVRFEDARLGSRGWAEAEALGSEPEHSSGADVLGAQANASRSGMDESAFILRDQSPAGGGIASGPAMGRSFFSFAQEGEDTGDVLLEVSWAQLAEEQPVAFVLSANEVTLDAFIISSSPEEVFGLWNRLEQRMEASQATNESGPFSWSALDEAREAVDAAVMSFHAALLRVATGTRPDISQEVRELARYLTAPGRRTVAQLLADIEEWKRKPDATRADAQGLRDEVSGALGVRVTLQRLLAVREALARFRADPEGAVAQLRRDATRCLEIRFALETVGDPDEKTRLESELAALPMMHILSDAEIRGLSLDGRSVVTDAQLADRKLGVMLDGRNTSLRSALRGTTDFTKDRTVAAGLQKLLRLDAAGYAMAFARVHVDDDDEGTRRFAEAVVEGDAIDEEAPKLAVAVAAAGLAGAGEILAGLGVAADAIAMAMLGGKLPLDAYALYVSGEAVGEAEWQWGEHQAALSEAEAPVDGWNGQWNRIGAWSGLALTTAVALGTDALLLSAGLSSRPMLDAAIDDVPQAKMSRGGGEGPSSGSAGGSRVEGRRGDVAGATLQEPDRRPQPVFVVEAKKVPGERALPVRETRTAVEPLSTDRPQPPPRMPSRDPEDIVGAFRSGNGSEADAMAARVRARVETSAARASARLGGAAESSSEEVLVVGVGSSRMDPVRVTEDQFMALKAANAGQRGPKVKVVFRVTSQRPAAMPQEGRGLVLQQMEVLEETQELDVSLASLRRLGIRVATKVLRPQPTAEGVQGVLAAPNGIEVSPEVLAEAQALSPAPEVGFSSAALTAQMEHAERAAAAAGGAAGLEGRPLVGPWSILRPETQALLEGAWPVQAMLAGMRPAVGSSSQNSAPQLVLDDGWDGVLPLTADGDVEEELPIRAGSAEEGAAGNASVEEAAEGRAQQVQTDADAEIALAAAGEVVRSSPPQATSEAAAAPRFPQFDRRIGEIMNRVSSERRADAQLAIDALLASVPAGSPGAVVGRIVGPGLKAIEAEYAPSPQPARLTKAEAEAQKAREARERLVARGVVTPEMAAAIDAYAAGGEAAAARVREAFLAAGGHSNATADIQAYNGLQGLLYEARRSAEVRGGAVAGTAGGLPRRTVRVRYNGVRFAPKGWKVQEKMSEIDLDIPEASGRIYEVKWSPRINYGENIDGSLNEGALNQVIKMNAAVEQRLFDGATIEVTGNVSPEFFALLGQWAPKVEVLYTLRLSGGQEVAFRMKRGPDGMPTLRRMPDIRALGERDQTILDGLRRVLQSGRIFRDGIFQNDFLTLADVPEMVPSYQEFRKVAGEDGRIDPRRITDLRLYQEWERRIQAKRLRVLEEKPTSTPLRRRTEHLTRPMTEEAIDEHMEEVERWLASAPVHTVKQYSLRRGTPTWDAVRAEFGKRLRAVAAYERERLVSAEEAGRQARRVAMGYHGPREGYPLDPLHIYMDVVKGAREAARGKGGGSARSYSVEWPMADAVFADIAAGRYARQERLIRIVSPTPFEPDVNEQLTNVREYRARDAAERRKVLDLLHERNRLRLRGQRDVLRPLITRRERTAIDVAEGALTSLIAERNERLHEIDASGLSPRERGPQMRAVAESYKGRIREVEEGILTLYEQGLGTSRYRQHFEYVEREEQSDIVKFIYTVDADGVMRLAHEELRPGAERPAHSELANGHNVYGAGQIWVCGTPVVGSDGQPRVVVNAIDDGSGHYRPDTIEMLPYVREVLRGYGFDVDVAHAEHAPLPVVPLDERFDEPVNPWEESPTRVR